MLPMKKTVATTDTPKKVDVKEEQGVWAEGSSRTGGGDESQRVGEIKHRGNTKLPLGRFVDRMKARRKLQTCPLT